MYYICIVKQKQNIKTMTTTANIPATLNWNTFTATFGKYLAVDWSYHSKSLKPNVVATFTDFIEKFGYSAVRDLIVRYMDYLMEGACYWSANYDLIGYKPAYYDYKYTKNTVLKILDNAFEN